MVGGVPLYLYTPIPSTTNLRSADRKPGKSPLFFWLLSSLPFRSHQLKHLKQNPYNKENNIVHLISFNILMGCPTPIHNEKQQQQQQQLLQQQLLQQQLLQQQLLQQQLLQQLLQQQLLQQQQQQQQQGRDTFLKAGFSFCSCSEEVSPLIYSSVSKTLPHIQGPFERTKHWDTTTSTSWWFQPI